MALRFQPIDPSQIIIKSNKTGESITDKYLYIINAYQYKIENGKVIFRRDDSIPFSSNNKVVYKYTEGKDLSHYTKLLIRSNLMYL